MRYPSVKRIQSVLGISLSAAQQIRTIMLTNTGCQSALYRAMQLIDAALGTYGVEYIPEGHNKRSPSITYCNTGDTYRPTVMMIRGQFVLGCWGDWVERGRYD